MKRSERLFAITELLRARRTGTTAEALAERFEVSVRTIYRDLDSLRAAALPVIGERGRGGGLALDRTYSLPPVNFSAREAAILVAAYTSSTLLPSQIQCSIPYIAGQSCRSPAPCRSTGVPSATRLF